MEANQIHPLLGAGIPTLSRSSLPSKLQIMNFIRFKTYRIPNKEKSGIYREVAKELISIWREAYIVCSDEECIINRIKNKLIPLLSKVQKNTKTYLIFPNVLKCSKIFLNVPMFPVIPKYSKNIPFHP